ncbi:hypothetical protein PR048_022726 [Dryococelus australis]|uniref:Uncharacterized protein n=1 Tax=Dryococelus australis TaxID=614101 RepID=A0ABQ9GS48_9NEOP|nr:hypothetical protein PR048_022726 [Dryococelus australis]
MNSRQREMEASKAGTSQCMDALLWTDNGETYENTRIKRSRNYTRLGKAFPVELFPARKPWKSLVKYAALIAVFISLPRCNIDLNTGSIPVFSSVALVFSDRVSLPEDGNRPHFPKRRILSSDGMKGWRKREIPEKTRRPAASSIPIPTCENPGVTQPETEPCSPWWEANSLTAQPPRPRRVGVSGRRQADMQDEGEKEKDKASGRRCAVMQENKNPRRSRARFMLTKSQPNGVFEYVRDSPKVNVWYWLMHDRVVGLCMLTENTVTGAKYLDMLELYVFPQIDDSGREQCIQSTATPDMIHRTWTGIDYRIDVRHATAVHDKVSTIEINPIKKLLPLPAYILTDALSDTRTVKLVMVDGK